MESKLPFAVAIPKEKLESNVDKLQTSIEQLNEHEGRIEDLQSLYDEFKKLKSSNDKLREALHNLDKKYYAVDEHARKAMRVVSSWTPMKGGNTAIDDDKSVISNPGVVHSNADKEEMRKHLSSLLH